MTLRETPPFRADHVGSLLRPSRLLEAGDRHAAGEIAAGQPRAIEDDAILEVVRMQRDAGLRSATDGEIRRTSWHMDFIYRLGGRYLRQINAAIKDRPAGLAVTTHMCRGALGRFRAAAVRAAGPDRGAVPAVRILLYGRGKRADVRGGGREAAAHRGTAEEVRG